MLVIPSDMYQKHNILEVQFDLITYELVMSTIDRWKSNRERHYVTLTNPYSVMLCLRDPQMRTATTDADMTLPDGIGIILAAHLLGYPHNGRVAGPTLMLKLCDWGRSKNYRHFFYGGAKGVAARLAHKLSLTYPGLEIAGTYCPPFRLLCAEEDQAIIEEINSTNPDLLWVGLGTPKQEKWMADHLGKIKATAMIGVGAAFDFHARNIKWAPAWIRSLGLEWAYRLVQEPKRMWRRNLDSPIFLSRVLCQLLRRTISSHSVGRHFPVDNFWR